MMTPLRDQHLGLVEPMASRGHRKRRQATADLVGLLWGDFGPLVPSDLIQAQSGRRSDRKERRIGARVWTFNRRHPLTFSL